MKVKRKSTAKDPVSNEFPFTFLERKHQKGKFESGYEHRLQTAIHGTKHTVTTSSGRTIHRKLISKPIIDLQENSQRGKGPRNSNGTFARKETVQADQSPGPSSQQTAPTEQVETATEPMETATEPMEVTLPTIEDEPTPTPTTQRENIGSTDMDVSEFCLGWKSPGVGRGKQKLIRNRSPIKPGMNLEITSSSATQPEGTLHEQTTDSSPTAEETTQDLNGSISYDRLLEKLPPNRGEGGNEIEIKNETDIEEISENILQGRKTSENIETRLQNCEERRSTRLTKTKPIIRLNNPIMSDCYRKHRNRPRNEEGSGTTSKRSNINGKLNANTSETPNKGTETRPNHPERNSSEETGSTT